MIDALILGFRQLADPAAGRLMLRCVLLTLATFVALFAVIATLLFGLDLTGWAWLDSGLAVVGSAAALVLAWLLFPVVAASILGLLADDVVGLVERRNYPELPSPASPGLIAQAGATTRFVLVALALNLLALPFYLLPGPNLPIYLALNGYLLGREYFELVAGRRLTPRVVAELRRKWRGRLWVAGVAIAGMLTVPVLNLVAPVVAIAFMVHLFVALARQDPAAVAPNGTTTRRGPVSDGSV